MDGFVDKGGLWVIGQALAFLLVASALVWTASDDVATILFWTGAVVALAGVALAADGVYRIRRHITALPAPLPGAPLVEEGSYALARHPIYGGLAIAALGLGIARGSVWGAAAAVMLGFFFVAKARHEERLLEAVYPEYGAYAARVRRRLIPWIV